MSDVVLTNGSPHLAGSGLATKNGRSPARAPRRAGAKPGAAEPYDALLWRLLSRRGGNEPTAYTLGVVGCEERAGATTVAAKLAIRASELQQGPVLLIEANAMRPKLAGAWKLVRGPALMELLAGEASLPDCVQDGPRPDLKVIPAVSGASHALQTWESGVVSALLAEAGADYRLVIVDLPAAGELNDSVVLARELEQVLLVVRAEQSRAPAVQRVTDQLVDDGISLAGVVLNRQRSYAPRWLQRWV